MAGPFESVTRVAIEEIIKEHAKPSKFGFFLTEDKLSEVVDGMFQLLLTSRTLKAAGDKLLTGVQPGESTPTRPVGAYSRPPR